MKRKAARGGRMEGWEDKMKCERAQHDSRDNMRVVWADYSRSAKLKPSRDLVLRIHARAARPSVLCAGYA